VKKRNKHSLKKFAADVAQQNAECLIELLNDIGTCADKEQQESLLQLDRLLTLLAELNRRSVCGERIDPGDLVPVNEILARYKWINQWVLTSEGYLYPQNEPVDVAQSVETNLSGMVVGLIEHGFLDLIRRCDYCNRFYLAKRREWRAESFCITEHQQAHWRKQPKVKAHRRKYQKRYYRDNLSPVTRKTRKRRRRAA
jgi:hypothetical protein